MPILEMKILKLSAVKSLAQGHMLRDAEQGLNPDLCDSKVCLTPKPSIWSHCASHSLLPGGHLQGPGRVTLAPLPTCSVASSALLLPWATLNMATKTHMVPRLRVLTQHVN